MQVAAAEVLGGDDLAGGGLHQRRATQEDGALVAHDDGLVAHRRDVGAAGGARAEHRGDLRNALGAHGRLVVEDAAEMFPVREHLVLARQERAAGVDEVDARQPVLQRDLLRAQMLLDRDRVVGAAFDRRVVGDDHALASRTPGRCRRSFRRRGTRRRTCRRRPAGPPRAGDCRDPAGRRRGRAAAACPVRRGARGHVPDRRARRWPVWREAAPPARDVRRGSTSRMPSLPPIGSS